VLSTTQIILLFITSFLPPIIYTIWIRNTERIHRERWNAIAICFLWGASIAIIAAIILEVLLDISISFSFVQNQTSIIQIIAVLMIAPFAEELVKPLALRNRIVNRELNEIEDGLIYGAVAGLGFSATENLLYGFSFLPEGLIYFLVLMSIRSVGGCLLHASATALTGFGYGKALLQKKSIIRVLPYFVVAMLMHASYNFLVSWEDIGVATGLILALIIVLSSWRYVRKKIRSLDR
jgi:RsiW-degrading membrane proteinase PrsW (M82 family)